MTGARRADLRALTSDHHVESNGRVRFHLGSDIDHYRLGVTNLLAGAGRAFYRTWQNPIDEAHVVLTASNLHLDGER